MALNRSTCPGCVQDRSGYTIAAETAPCAQDPGLAVATGPFLAVRPVLPAPHTAPGYFKLAFLPEKQKSAKE